MKCLFALSLILSALAMAGPARSDAGPGDPEAGQRIFRACVSCHSLEPGRHMTGPSLAGVWHRRAGTAEGFSRYSDALKGSGLVWDADTLDAWLADPRRLVPGNRMTFPGLPEPDQRRDLIAFLRQAAGEAAENTGGKKDEPAANDRAAGQGGMMGRGDLLDLKTLESNNQVTAISLCGDTYSVTAGTGEVYQFWEFNLRFKTDGSDKGPDPGHPVIIPAGMRGDRAYVIFASPAEISPFVSNAC